MLPIVIASDHAGFSLKEQVKKHLEEKGIEYIDLGTNSTESVAYPEYASKLCCAIQEGKANMGILVCGTGIGMSMAANKHKGIRAACVSDTFSAKATRMHNDANVLCFGERVVGAGLAFELVDAFLGTEYEGGRHQVRVDMLNSFDK
ncbi:MAG: ribose 5-phosphate isomerase B [Ruminococcaceae bacterium]|nr:ribose 5-phosphate isomerase B [Oscillospiraceae bacterium]